MIAVRLPDVPHVVFFSLRIHYNLRKSGWRAMLVLPQRADAPISIVLPPLENVATRERKGQARRFPEKRK